jgi:hypothetical protein
LLTGAIYFRQRFRDPDTFREAWDIHREALTAEWVQKVRKNWTCMLRPFAWWFCDHGQERPVINPHFSQREIDGLRNDKRQFDRFGFLHTHIYGGPDMGPLQEQEGDYLDRLGLLTDEERAYIDSLDALDASEPELDLTPCSNKHRWPHNLLRG